MEGLSWLELVGVELSWVVAPLTVVPCAFLFPQQNESPVFNLDLRRSHVIDALNAAYAKHENVAGTAFRAKVRVNQACWQGCWGPCA